MIWAGGCYKEAGIPSCAPVDVRVGIGIFWEGMEEKTESRRLPSPEQLDRMLTIIHVPGWIALVCLVGIVIGIVAWAFFGQLPIFVEGKGIFFDPRAIYVVETDLQGRIGDVFVDSGDVVDAGQALMRLDNLSKEQELLEIEKKIAFLQGSGKVGSEGELFDLQLKKEAVLAYIERLMLRSPFAGSVLALNAIRGEFVQPGQNLAWLQKKLSPKEKQKIFAFFSTDAGGMLQPGMEAHVAFVGIDSQMYGKLVGSVEKIIAFTGAHQGEILQSLPSEEWRALLAGGGADYIVVIDPVVDPSTASGYRWTTKMGPPFKVPPDALASATVILKEQRPIQYLIP